ncbi:MAG: hypothetical protein E7503_06665 [Ruminococcus sp.]|nr:hypothetical protein [Ruminococcus sp.]
MTPLELMQWSEGLADLYTGLETDLIANIAAYLAKGSADSSTAQWKLQMLAQMGALNRQNLQTILSYSDIITEEMQAALETAALAAIEELEPGFRQLAREGFINDTDIPVDVTTAAVLKAYRKQAQDALNMVNTVMQYKAKAAARRLINDTAELADKPEFLAMLNKAAGSMVTGGESRQAALRRCIHQMTEKGIPAFVDKLGREWTPEAYINMDLRTTMSNVAHQVQFDRMDAYDLTLLEVSSHAGARPKCAKDQGKIFNRNGSGGYTTDLHGRKIRYYAWKDSSYGEPDGLLGINCGHHVYPFTPGIDVQRYFPYDEKENDALYQKMQHQRELERRVRRSKRECMMLETTGDTEGFAKASVTLKQREQALKQYCADEGLDYKNDRTAVVGYGRSTAAKASAAAKRKLAEQTRKRLDKSAESGIMESRDKKAGGLSAPIVPSKVDTTKRIGSDTFSEEARTELFRDERIISGNAYETASLYNANGEKIFRKKGTQDSVTFTAKEMKLMHGGILTHNHPNGSVFSAEDINMLRRGKLAEIRACNRLGTYVLQTPGAWPKELSSLEDIRSAYDRIMAEAGEKYKDIAAQEGRSILYYLDRMDEDAMDMFSKEFGLIFRWEAADND